MSLRDTIYNLKEELPDGVALVAVSKTYPPETIMEAYEAGQRVFGENRPQELRTKYDALPKDIRWHMIGNLQTNKVKYIAPFVELIHSVDSEKLLQVIDKEAAKNDRVIDFLFEMHIAEEESKHGWDRDELRGFLGSGRLAGYRNVRPRGMMGMATFTDDMEAVGREFAGLKRMFDEIRAEYFPGGANGGNFDILSMGMTSDYPLAVANGATMVRIGSLIFGSRA